jgi:hypothetical protein
MAPPSSDAVQVLLLPLARLAEKQWRQWHASQKSSGAAVAEPASKDPNDPDASPAESDDGASATTPAWSTSAFLQRPLRHCAAAFPDGERLISLARWVLEQLIAMDLHTSEAAARQVCPLKMR